MSQTHVGREIQEVEPMYKGELISVDEPKLRPDVELNKFRLARSIGVIYRNRGGKVKSVVVPEGFVTDGASIPKLFWSSIGSPYCPRFITGAVVHDYMCEQDWDVEEMSDLFLLLLLDSMVGEVKASLMETAVRLYKSVV